MSHDDSETDAKPDPFETDESTAYITVAGRSGSGKTSRNRTAVELARHVEDDAESVEFIDPKGDGDVECPLSEHPPASESVQNAPEDATNGEEGGETL